MLRSLKQTIPLFACLALSLTAVPTITEADIRFYRITKKKQQKLLMSIKNEDKAGCHNTLFAKRLYHVVMSKFQQCQVYRSRDCPAGDEIVFRWTGRELDALEGETTTTAILPGSKWFVAEGINVKFSSWRCQ